MEDVFQQVLVAANCYHGLCKLWGGVLCCHITKALVQRHVCKGAYSQSEMCSLHVIVSKSKHGAKAAACAKEQEHPKMRSSAYLVEQRLLHYFVY
jgi:light-regulated signal transduction histidine kinase (bacteriophytochrome)